MTHPDRHLDDVNAHLDALFLIADASKPDPEQLDNRLRLAAHADNHETVMRYLATYAASLLRRLREHQALPSDPADYLADISALVAGTVPGPE